MGEISPSLSPLPSEATKKADFLSLKLHSTHIDNTSSNNMLLGRERERLSCDRVKERGEIQVERMTNEKGKMGVNDNEMKMEMEMEIENDTTHDTTHDTTTTTSTSTSAVQHRSDPTNPPSHPTLLLQRMESRVMDLINDPTVTVGLSDVRRIMSSLGVTTESSSSAMLRRRVMGLGDKMEDLPIEGMDYGRVGGRNCDNCIGFVPVPVGVAGPVDIGEEGKRSGAKRVLFGRGL